MLQFLLLEDDPIDRELIEATLKSDGIESSIVCVSQRQGFIEGLKTHFPDLILADYRMPGFDGLAALELANSICPDVPFILVSGVLGEEQAIDAMKRGATDYVLKQRLERLVPAIQRALQESQERQERQRIAKALHQTNDLLRAIVEASPVPIITLSPDQKVMTWNKAAEELYGWQMNTIIDQPLPLIPDRQKAAFNRCFTAALQNRTVSDQEFQHCKQDGSRIDVSLSLASFHDADDEIYGVVMTVIDETVRNQVEAQRLGLLKRESSARAAAESANRIKDEFLAVLSHELRTPLNAIVGWVNLIQRGNLKPKVLQRALNTIERNAAVQTQLIEDLLDLSRIIRGQVSLSIQPVDIAALVNTTVDTLRPAATAKSIQINLNIAPNLARILVDPNRIQQVLWNLLSNAIKFTPASGQITIQVEPIDTFVKIQVTDSGIGIAPDFLPHVFEHFRQADGSSTRPQGGLGLGLAITRNLVELHGGTIQADSPGIGKGATFTVVLPVRLTQEKDGADQSLAENEANLEGIKAIIIDDEADARELLTVVLEEQGAQVESTGTAQEALESLEWFRPDIIVSDVGMPEEDGYNFLQTVRSLSDHQLRSIPAIALTAYAREEDRQLALKVGYQAHIAKPFNPSEVVNTIYELTHTAKK